MSDGFAFGAHRTALRTQMAVGIDLHLYAAVAENSFGHDCDHVHAIDLRRNDERRGLVVGIGCARANRGHKGLAVVGEGAIPLASALQEWNDRLAALDCTIEYYVRIKPHQFALVVAVAVARSSPAGLDVAQHGAGIAADRVISHAVLHSPLPEWRPAHDRAWREFYECGRRRHHEWH